ncbi:DJ-1/PfpI family protein [Parafrankia sp. FMc6]|uniref:DJ-1/PfpI family protein n=1 Tax=Parafrankia soli TaxID=2599596 RepID=UPI0034D412C9
MVPGSGHYDGFTALDLAGPQVFLAGMTGAEVIVAAGRAPHPVTSDTGLAVVATHVLEDLPARCDVLLVPGAGGGLAAALDNQALLGELARLGAGAGIVASVCIGSLLLGAAGLLHGRRATSHWTSRPHLSRYGATTVNERVVDDGSLVAAAGVTAGVDLGLLLVGRLRGAAYAETLSLQAETVTPAPAEVDSTLVDDVRDLFSGVLHRSLGQQTDTSRGRRRR